MIGTVYCNYHHPALTIIFIFPDLLPKILWTSSPEARIYICVFDVCHMGWWCVTPVAICFQRCRPSTDGTVLTGTNWKQDSPVKMACRLIEVTLMGCNVVFRGVDALEGSRLQKRGHSMSILACTSTLSNAVELWTKVNPKFQVRSGPQWPSVAPFIGKTYDIIARPVMSWIHHGMMSSVFHVTPYHNVTSWWCKHLWAPNDVARQRVCMCIKWLMSLKIPCMSYPPQVFGSALASRAFYRFIANKNPNTHVHTISSIKLRHNSSHQGMS